MHLPHPCTLLLFLAAPLQAAREAIDQEERPPNVILILADDLGWGDLSCHGGKTPTPAIDALAHEGLSFRAAYSAGPNCSPSRASLMTGRYTPRHGIYTVGSAARGKASGRKLIPVENKGLFEFEERTIAEELADSGYRTGIVGKWHLSRHPTRHGFEWNRGGHERGHPKSYFSPYGNPELTDGPDGEYLTSRLTDEAIAFIEAFRDEAFFLYVPYYTVHSPYQAPPQLVKELAKESGETGVARATFDAMVASLDAGVARLMAALDEFGLEERTLVVFTSDNGGVMGISSAGPFRGGKGELYEGGIRVPMLMRLPGRIPAGTEVETAVHHVDLFPTLLDLVGRPRPSVALDGRSLAGLMFGGAKLPERALYWHFPAYLEGRGERDWRTTPVGALRFGRYKLLEFFEDNQLELYDLEQDPAEVHNLVADQESLTQELRGRLQSWREKLRAEVPQRANPDYVPEPESDGEED